MVLSEASEDATMGVHKYHRSLGLSIQFFTRSLLRTRGFINTIDPLVDSLVSHNIRFNIPDSKARNGGFAFQCRYCTLPSY